MQIRVAARPFPIESGIPRRIDRVEIRRWLARRVPLLQMFLALTVLLTVGAFSLPAYATGQDFVEDYASGRALLAGTNPYAPLNDLLSRYVPDASQRYPHPNAHPPLLILLGLPFAAIPYTLAAPLWLAFSIFLLLLVGQLLGLRGWARLLPLAWPPLWTAVVLGGSEMVLLVLLVAAWKMADRDRDSLAGALLGVAAALKLFPLLFFVPYLARRRRHLVAAGAVTVGLSQTVNLALVGPTELYRYYFQSLPAFNHLFVGTEINVTPYGALLRIFGGASDVSPLVNAPVFAQILAFVIALAALFALARLRPEAAPLAYLVAAPSAWTNYVALVLPQLLALWHGGNRRFRFLVAAGAASWVFRVVLVLPVFSSALAGAGPSANVALVLLGAIQPIGLIALLALSWPRDKVPEIPTATADSTVSATAG